MLPLILFRSVVVLSNYGINVKILDLSRFCVFFGHSRSNMPSAMNLTRAFVPGYTIPGHTGNRMPVPS